MSLVAKGHTPYRSCFRLQTHARAVLGYDRDLRIVRRHDHIQPKSKPFSKKRYRFRKIRPGYRHFEKAETRP